MLDGRILAAVFATLAAVGAAMNGGAVNAGDFQAVKPDSSVSFDAERYVPDSFRGLSKIFQNPEPHNEVQSVLEVENLDEQTFDMKADRLYAANLTSANIGSKEMISDEEVVFYGFSGKVMPGTRSEIKGKSQGVVSSGVNVSGRFRTEREFETEYIRVEGVERSRIRLNKISGTIDSNSTTARVKGTDNNLRINSFSGNMTLYPMNGTVALSGRVDKLSAGDVSFGH